jgi:carboxylate-amine ligase
MDFVNDVVDDLGGRREINYLRSLLEDPRGTGADRQIATYRQTGRLDTVIRLLMQQTIQGTSMEMPVEVAAD